MKKIFGNIKMTWARVAIFAVCVGVYTGVVMLFDFLRNTSFQDIGITYEWWVIFAIIVVINCKKNFEAALKCFVFFLISQPLVYIVQIIFGDLTLKLALNYYLTIWLPATFLTLIGGFIAFYCKKQNIIGALILGLGNTVETVLGIYYLSEAIKFFPHHLLSALFCFASVFILSFFIQKSRKERIIAVAVPAILSGAVAVYAVSNNLTFI